MLSVSVLCCWYRVRNWMLDGGKHTFFQAPCKQIVFDDATALIIRRVSGGGKGGYLSKIAHRSTVFDRRAPDCCDGGRWNESLGFRTPP